ncbi:uncharacterized protein LOC141855147 [Brevipalpus obovatus]|uniref:uncharacterized protein LOC141855147 n=1 Tax=Brevipalpus obovatus TaxID=246614 RepID=UPI003D9DC1FA
MAEESEKDKFMKKLAVLRGLSSPPMPIVEDQVLDLFLLYNSVKRFGGHEEVCRTRNWKAVTSLCKINVNPSTINAIRHLYTKYLTCIEQDEAQLAKNDDPTCTDKVGCASQPSLPHSRPLPPIPSDNNVAHTDDSRLNLNSNTNDLAMSANLPRPTSYNPLDLPYHRYLTSQVPTCLDTDRLGLSAFGYLQLIDWIYILDGFKIVYKDVNSDKEISILRECADFIFEQIEKDGIKELLKYGALEKLVLDWGKTDKTKKLDLNFFDPLRSEIEALMTKYLRKVFLNKRIQEKKSSLVIPHSKSSISLDKSVAYSMDSAYYSDFSQITASSEVSGPQGSRGYRDVSALRSHHSENNHNFKILPKTIPLQRESLKVPILTPRKPSRYLPSQFDLDDPNVRSLTDKLKNLETS